MEDKNKKLDTIFPEGFFQKTREHVSEISPEEDMIPFEWHDDVLNGKVEVVITKENRNS